MCKLTFITLLFNLFTIIYTFDTRNQADHVLPLVFFLRFGTNSAEQCRLEPPDSLDSNNIVTDKKRIVNGTNFTLEIEGDQDQMFFCPKTISGKNCLAPQGFQGLDPLECSEEPEPVILVDSTTESCGSGGVGKPREFVYEFCSGYVPYEVGIKKVQIYKFCYDEINEKTLFTSHYIMSPRLLRSDAMIWERNTEYPMKTYKGYTPSNYKQFKAAIEEEKNSKTVSSPREIKQREYKVQKLIPEEDMAFALWKKPTSQFLNVEWQHEKLILLWNEINELISRRAETLFIMDRIRTHVETGVFQLNSVKRSDGQLSNVWVKIIYTMPEMPGKTATSGVAVMMNNFIEEMNQAAILNPKEPNIESYCDDNLCTDKILNTFVSAGGKVACCPLNNKIRGLFGGKGSFFMPTLYIPGLIKALTGKVVIW